MSYNLDVDIIDFLDLINETLSYSFVEKWRHKYSEKFIKHFQFKILDARLISTHRSFTVLTRRLFSL